MMRSCKPALLMWLAVAETSPLSEVAGVSCWRRWSS